MGAALIAFVVSTASRRAGRRASGAIRKILLTGRTVQVRTARSRRVRAVARCAYPMWAASRVYRTPIANIPAMIPIRQPSAT
jgi:hypothetical protein